jgi:hypothetical protein
MALGVGALLATAPALRVLGFPDPDPAARALGMLAGGRDIVLGALPFLFRDQQRALRHAVAAGAAVDAIDAAGLGLMALRRSELGRAGAVGAVSGGAAAIAGP